MTLRPALIVCLLAAPLGAGEVKIDLRETQLFLDDAIIEHSTLLQRTVHQPVRSSRNPIYVPEAPWEGGTMNYLGGVHRDENTRKFRAWYVGRIGRTPDLPKVSFPICLLESDDGLRWRRPDLDVQRELTGGLNNILLDMGDGCTGAPSVIQDSTDPTRRWKFLIHHSTNTRCRDYRVSMASSLDGVNWRWETGPGAGVKAGSMNDRLTATFDPANGGSFLLFSRGRGKYNHRVRTIYRARLSRDGRSLLDEPALALKPDLEDDPSIEFYHMNAFRYGSVYIGYIEVFRAEEPERAEIHLAVSRDGISWQRVRPRKAFMEPPPRGIEYGQWDAMRSTPTLSAPLLHEGALWIYYYGGQAFHGNRFLKGGECKMGLAKLRPDGFISLRAGFREGVLTTKPLEWPGGRLTVNYREIGGNRTNDCYVRAELLDENGPIPGYTYAESSLLNGDSLEGEPSWSGKPQNLDGLIGKKIRLQFYVRHADLFSFRARGKVKP
ncbi:MAG: hypothetical protein ACKV22_41930 [Bryobacteraceae bacterium]